MSVAEITMRRKTIFSGKILVLQGIRTVHSPARPVRTKTDASYTPAGQIGNAFLCIWKYLYALEKVAVRTLYFFHRNPCYTREAPQFFGIYAENSRKYYNNSMKYAEFQVRNRSFPNELLT